MSHFLRLRLAALALLLLVMSGCVVQHTVAITADKEVDPRLEGVWQITPKTEDEIKTDRDEDVMGVQEYVVIGKIDEGTYRVVAMDSFKADRSSVMVELDIRTRKHGDATYMLLSVPKNEREKKGDEARDMHNMVLDYRIDDAGQLFIQFVYIGDIGEALKLHPIEYTIPDGPMPPVTLQGDEAEVLAFYADPKVRALFQSFGKYRKLSPPAE